MKETLQAVREAYRLIKTDDATDTLLAVAILAVFIGPMVWRLLQERQKSQHGK